MRKLLLALFALLLFIPAAAEAQTVVVNGDTIYELRTSDGSKHIGKIVAQQGDSITFETLAGLRLQVSRPFVRLRAAQGRVVEGEFWRTDRNSTRLFFAPTGRVLEAGTGYAGLFFVLPFIGFGISDNFTLAGGIPLVGSLSETPIWVAPKLRVINKPRTQGSLGVLAIRIPDADDEDFCDPSIQFCEEDLTDGSQIFGIGYGIATFGDQDNAFHVGAGVAFGDDVESDVSRFPLMVGGEWRTGMRWKVITENWLIPGEVGLASIGMRRIGEHWTWDFGLMALLEEDSDLPYFPIISFSYSWGH